MQLPHLAMQLPNGPMPAVCFAAAPGMQLPNVARQLRTPGVQMPNVPMPAVPMQLPRPGLLPNVLMPLPSYIGHLGKCVLVHRLCEDTVVLPMQLLTFCVLAMRLLSAPMQLPGAAMRLPSLH